MVNHIDSKQGLHSFYKEIIIYNKIKSSHIHMIYYNFPY